MMKAKSNHSNKKPLSIIIKLIIWIPIVTVVFLFAVTLYLNKDYKSWNRNFNSSVEKRTNETLNSIQEILNSEGVKSVKNQVTLRILSSSNSNGFFEWPAQTFIKISDRKTGETIVDSSQQIVMLVADEELESRHDDNVYKNYTFFCNDNDIKNWMLQLSDEYSDEMHHVIFLTDEYEFTDTEHFIPDTILAFSVEKNSTECIGIYSRNKGEINNYSSFSVGDSFDPESDYWINKQLIYVLGSNTDEDDYPQEKKYWYDKHYGGNATEGHYWDYPKLVHNYWEYNRSFLKGDYMFIKRIPFKTYAFVNDEATPGNYVLEFYVKSNYWQENSKVYLLKIFIYYCVCLLITLAVLTIQHAMRKANYEKEAYRRTLTDSISHDLKSPLTALRGYAESLKENLNEDKRVQYSDAILESADYMNHLINGNIELLRLEDMGSVGKKEAVDFVEVTKALLEKYNLLLEERGITVEISGQYEKKVNKELITSALENLVSNSVKYVSDNGNITLNGTQDGYVISNTTDKLPDKKPKELWETFVKGDDSRSNEKGSGLGLAIAKQIFDKHKIKAKIDYKKDTNSFEVNLS
ncbi:MAG: HAMP domain-containing histidine kinase [Lachnospiraceae bacterium]|nr:HAMP domain-containing histidine kinase [Lachnospiraceae bacterium]